MNDLVIRTENLTKVYGEQEAVKSVNVHVKKGRIYGLLGRNGAGKTNDYEDGFRTDFHYIRRSAVVWKNIRGQEKRIYPRIGAIIENAWVLSESDWNRNLEILQATWDIPPGCRKNALEVVGLPYKDKKLFSKYSLGMKQRLGIANAIMHDPELLILDEPINGLDPIGIAEIRKFLQDLSKERGKTILISSHILSEIDLLADDIGIIHEGNLLEESSMDELRKKNQKYVLFRVSSTATAARILEQKCGGVKYRIEDDNVMRIYDMDIDLGMVNQVFITNNIGVYESSVCDESLEDYFKEITGGVGIA